MPAKRLLLVSERDREAPGFGDRRPGAWRQFEHVTQASWVVVDREHTTIVDGKAEKRLIDVRCRELRTQIAYTTLTKPRGFLAARAGGRDQPRTVNTGHVAARTTDCVVDPNSASPTPPRPWAPMTMRFACFAAAVSRIS